MPEQPASDRPRDEAYVDDNNFMYPPGDSQQFDPTAEFMIFANALGGKDP